MAAVAVAASVASTVVGVAAAQQQAAQAQAMAAYQAGVARNNAIIAQREVEDAARRRDIELENQRKQASQTLGRTKTGFSAAGVVVDNPLDTPVLVLGSNEREYYGDALFIYANAAREQDAAKARVMNFEQQARFAELEGANAKAAGKTDMFSTLLGGIGGVSDTVHKMFPKKTSIA